MNIKRALSLFLSVTLLASSLAIPSSAIEAKEPLLPSCCGTDSSWMETAHDTLLQRKTAELQQELGIAPMRLIKPGQEHFKLLPSTGDVNMLVLPITYAEYPEREAAFERDKWQELFFAPYDPETEMLTLSLRGFFYQASCGKLDINGVVLPAYRVPLSSSQYEKDSDLRQQMYRDALNYYCDQGLDISQFDNDGDGTIDGLIICELRAFTQGSNISGAIFRLHGEVNGYQLYDYARILGIYHGDLTLNGHPYGELSNLSTCMHEVGHLLGLPDNYNISGLTNVIDGKLFELMSGEGRYINAYYKYLLDWIDPIILTNEDKVGLVDLAPVDQFAENLDGSDKAVVLIPDLTAFPFAEYYMAEYRAGGMMWDPRGRLLYDEAPGVVIWHCNTYVDTTRFDKPYTEQVKYLKPIYKSGAESGKFQAKDIYMAGDEFSSDTIPNSDFYDGTHTGAYLKVEEITPDKATIQVGFKDPNLLPGPMVEVSLPSKTVLRNGETSTVIVTTKVGDQLLSPELMDTFNIFSISTSGAVSGAGVSASALKNPRTITVPGKAEDGAIWIDIPAGAVRYNGKDSPAVTSEKIYIDNTPPEITLQGDNPQKIQQGAPYTELGAVATDNLDPEIEGKLQIDATKVNTNVPDAYKVTYSVTDHAGHTSTKERTVVVEAHTHQYASTWCNDENGHWHECECGEKADLTPHSPEPIPGQEATCTQPGKTEGSRCSICGRTLVAQENIPPQEHTFSTNWNRDATNHWRECTVCHGKTELGNHTENSGVTTKEPTQEETGIKTYSCSVCGYVMRTEVIDKLEPSHTHSYPEQWSHDASNHWKECTTCHEKTDQTPHTWDGGVVTTAPSSSKAGVRTYTCTVCKRTRTETIPATGGGSSGGGDGGGGGSTLIPTEYKVTLPGKTTGGSVKASSVKAVKGTKVTLSVEAEDGYELEELRVRDKKGKEITLEEKEGKYTFSMPASNVEVTVLFRELPKEEPKEEPAPPSEKEPDPIVLPFTDVPEKAWYYDAVKEVYNRGIMTGLSETQFAPELPASRGMVVTMLHRMEGQPAIQGGAGFTDVPEKQYYAPAVAWATEMGLVNGYGDNTFRPNEGITREQLVTILYRYAEWKGQDVDQRADLSRFFDEGRISRYARESMAWAKAAGLLNGADWGGIAPGGEASRGQIAVILERFLEL